MAKEKIKKKKQKSYHQEGTKKITVSEKEYTKKGFANPKVSQEVSQAYDKKTGNIIVKLVNTIDSTLERLQDDSWIYKSYGFRPSRRGKQQAQPMGMQPGTPQMIR